MRKLTYRPAKIFLFLLLVSLTSGLIGPRPLEAGVEFSGRIKLFTSFYLNTNKSGPYFFHEAGEFALKRLETRFVLSSELSSKVSFYARVDTYSSPEAIFGSPPFPEATSLGVPVQSEPFEGVLYEGLVKISDFIIPHLDLTIGKQRISWGTADKMNAVDNLNPIDLANFLSFDPDYFAERRPQMAFNWEWWLGASHKLQFVWLLGRQYAPLPRGFTRLLTQAYDLTEIRLVKDNYKLQNPNFGFRWTGLVGNFDFGVSYYRGNAHLPVFTGVEVSATKGIIPYFSYPRENIFGLDLAGELRGVGLWAEAALVVPEDSRGFVEKMILVNNQPIIYRDEFDLFAASYLRFVVGFDYTLGLGNGLYINAQYLHGFFDERSYTPKAKRVFGWTKGMFFGELEDYLVMRTEYRLFREALKLQLGSILELAAGKRAMVILPEIEWKIKDLVVLQAGGYLTTGDKEGTKFGIFREDKVAFIALKLDF
ncbi:hypothetical protein NLC35_00960 [Candidatus Aminicenantes bacterium AC-334-K16]|jgi:hypothetical protein|nr:hypothetical protein [Candidatus Aminicenantes bacterium AC-334-K16]